jgi:AraC family transcriptional regulator of adaptative response/methylated-DNA-[protein]-cysteine methyltransferase
MTPALAEEPGWRYGRCDTPFGPWMIVWNRRGIRAAHFGMEESLLDMEGTRHDREAALLTSTLFPPQDPLPPLDLCGTPFQIRVWQTLLTVPRGSTVTYGDLARQLGIPRAARAVGRAVASNSLAYLVPCHRVVPKSGGSGNYRWGSDLKTRILLWEQSLSIGAADRNV